MTDILICIPLLFAAASFFIPSNLLRAWMLPVGGALQMLMVMTAVFLRQAPYQDNWFGIDPLGRLVLLLVSVLFCLCSIYGLGYLRLRRDWDNRIFVICLFIFLGAMSMAAVARHMGLLWVAVEATTLASAPLIYFNRNKRSIEATWKYLLLCSVGIALAMLGILFVAYSALPAESVSLQLDDLLAQAPGLSKPWLRAGFVFLLIGFGTKVGFAPLHTWKPDAYGEAPGMIGALLSGGLTSVAFLALLRSMQIMNAAGQGHIAQQGLLIMGILSLLFAGVFVIKQPDFKRLLAYSSVEHMGILAIGFSIGGLAAFGAALHMMSNALTKGVLFLSAGNIHRRFASKRRDDVTGAVTVLPLSASLFIAGFFAITGSPPFGLFVSEFTILREIFQSGHYGLGAYVILMLTITFIGMGSTVMAVTLGRHNATEEHAEFHDTALTTLPPLILLLLALVLGLYLPEPLKDIFANAANLIEVAS